jgi:hypothetical protein
MKFFQRERATVKQTKATEAKEAQTKAAAPVKSELELLAEREAKRGAVISNLANEARMWREFATGCKTGRSVNERYGIMACGLRIEDPLLVHTMDEITAESWKAFALSMATSAEHRLREVLGA